MAFIYTALLIIGLTTLNGVAAMDPLQTDKVERFKRRIDFDKVLKAESADKLVRAIWPDALSAPALGPGWSVADNTIGRTRGGSAREWVLRRGDETVSILIFVSEGGVQPARQFFLLRASNNMMMEVPYLKGPAGLGTLAVHLSHKQAPSFIWVYRNTTFQVDAQDTSLDILPIARWLQATAESGLVAPPTAQLSLPGPTSVSARRVPVGQPIEIGLTIPTAGQSNYQMKLEFDRQMLEVVSQRGLAAQVRGIKPGSTALDLWLIERSTLLSAPSRIDLEFTPQR
jgi:hypothetical protein